ncbi:MAG: efflux transporter outer membrane subunit [Bdellovibrionales bacterium]|jgi:NodT family efflux transporter outer membrane factor (OMF) lipoprotein
MMKFNTVFLSSWLLAALPLLGGCAVGPDFKTPEAPTVASYGENGMPKATAGAKTSLGGVQRFLAGGDVPAAWWTLFESAPLNDLITQAVKANPSLEAARASLRVAQETATASYGGFFPSLDGSASDNRKKTSAAGPYTLYNVGVSVSYTPDIFGVTRRTTEAADAAATAQRFELEAAYLTLTDNVVTTAVLEASLREQIKATQEIIAAQKKQLELTKAQLDAGAIAAPAYLAQAATVSASETALPPLEKQLAASRNLMAVLLGRFPSEGVGATFTLASFKLPSDLPLTLPSKLVEQRPDIRTARANLEAANAEIGIAMGAMLPQFPLTASYGVSAGEIASLFTPGTALWGLGAGLLQPLFKGGELLHKKRAKEAAFDAAAAQYRATVLAAFQNVADSLKALESDAASLKAQLAAEQASAQSLALTETQFKAGAINYVALLAAQSSYQTAKIALIKAKASRLSDTAALFQALGGGWWGRTAENGEAQ